MADYSYPATPYDRARQFLAALGSFWNEVYAARDQVQSFVTAKAQVEQQASLDLLELISAMSRYTVPIYHRDNWHLLTIRESERNDAQTSLLRHDAGATYDSGHQYDVPTTRTAHAFPAPALLADVQIVMNRFTEPSLTWFKDVDFVLDENAIIFRENPFTDTRVAKRPIYAAGAVVDQEAAIWLFRGEFDWDTVYRQFGYVLGVRLSSSAGYRDLLNAVFDAITGGTASQQLRAALSAMTGVPLAIEPSETVEQVILDRQHLLVVTDRHAYRFNQASAATVAVGDVVHAGDTLTDALEIIELNRGITPDDLQTLALGRGFLAACFYGDLVFENKDVPLEIVTDDPSGFTKLQFGLGGFPLDVERFFDDMHERGVSEALRAIDECDPAELISYPANDCDGTDRQGRRGTLAHLLDQRVVRTGEPLAASLPRTINPLQFLVKNVLRNNAVIIRIRAAGLGSSRVGLHNLRLLRKIVPPHTAVIVIVELTAAAEVVTVDQVAETLSTFTAMEPLQDEVPVGQVSERVGLRVVSGTCQ